MHLERVEIQRLRGIPSGWPTLEFGDKGLIVYGPNGVGKSSIIDALEKTIADRSTLFRENRTGVNWETASEHVLGGPASASVYGRLSGKPVKLTLGVAPPPELEAWVAAGQAASFVLRRYMLLDFINAQPKPRYVQIEPFLNLKEFLNLELGLKQTCEQLDTAVVSGETQLSVRFQRIQQVFNRPFSEKIERDVLMSALKAKLAEAGLPAEDGDLADLRVVTKMLSAELGGEETSQRLAALGAARGLLQKLTNVALLKPLYDNVLQADEALKKALSVSAKKVPVALLQATHEHVANYPADTCPICEQAIDPGVLLKQLESRIKEDEAVAVSARTLDDRIALLYQAVQSALQVYNGFVTGWRELGLGDLPDGYGVAVTLLEQLSRLSIQNAAEGHELVTSAFASVYYTPMDEMARIDDAIVATGGGERRARIVEAQSYVVSLQDDVSKHEQLVIQQKTLTKRKDAATQLYTHAVEARKEAVQTIANRVANLANSFYNEMHPDEGIANSKLSVRTAASASMNFSTMFYGKNSSPLLYYSESHLDTLGLCYFLAMRKLEVQASPTFKLLLMDDVLHSVDAAHRVRIARILKVHFSDLQLVLVTHDKIFYDRLRETLGSGYKYVAVTGWDINSGPKLSDPFTDLDIVTTQTARAGRSHTDIAAAGGRFMEYYLKKVAEHLQVPLQARFSREHDLGSLWPPVAKALRKHKGFVSIHPNLITDLDDNDWVRNKIAAHDNESESPVVPQEVFVFVDKLAELYHATNCGGCGSVIKKSNTGNWRCECSKLHYDG